MLEITVYFVEPSGTAGCEFVRLSCALVGGRMDVTLIANRVVADSSESTAMEREQNLLSRGARLLSMPGPLFACNNNFRCGSCWMRMSESDRLTRASP